MFATKTKDAKAARQERAREAKDRVAATEAEIKRIEREIKAHDKDVAKIKAHLKKTDEWGRTELSDMWVLDSEGTPTMNHEAGKLRVRHGKKLRSDLGAAQRRLTLERTRAREAEAQAEPLSEMAHDALERLAAEAVLRDELVRRGQTLPTLNTPADRARVLDLAAEYGIRVD